MTAEQATNPAAYAAQWTSLQFVINLLQSSDLAELGESLTQQLRELTGARTVILATHPTDTGDEAFCAASPHRRQSLLSLEELALMCPLTRTEELPRRTADFSPEDPVRLALARAGIESALRFPLGVGEEHVGSLLLFDLPEPNRTRDAEEILEAIRVPLALAVRNALAQQKIRDQEAELRAHSEVLERTVAERTRELAESEEKYRLLIENQNDLVIQFDGDWRLQFVSPSYCRTFGKTEEELLGKQFLPLVHADDREHVLASLATLTAPPHTCFHEERAATAHGWRWFAWSDRAEVDEAGRVVKVIAVGRDITKRKRAEEELQRSEQRQRSLFDDAPVMYVVTRAEQLDAPLITDCNNEFLSRLGYERDEVIGKPLTSFYTPDSARAMAESDGYHRAMEGVLDAVERQLVTRDGRVLHTAARGTPERDATGRVIGTRASFLDISEWKRTEAELNASRELLDSIRKAQTRFLEDAAPEEVFAALLETLVSITRSEYGFLLEVLRDSDGTPYFKSLALSDLAWDEGSRRLYGELTARNYELRTQKNLIGAILETGDTVIANEAASDPRRGGLPPGHPEIRAFMGLPMRFGGRLVGVAGVANREGGYTEDIAASLEPFLRTCAAILRALQYTTEREELLGRLREREARLETAVADLAAINAELEQFAYTVSHDLKSPLITLSGFADCLQHDIAAGNEAAINESLVHIARAATEMGSLLDGVLALSRVGRVVGERRPVPLPTVVDDALRMTAGLLEHATVEVAFPDDLPEVLGDAGRLRQVFENLLSNAGKFTRDCAEPRVEVGARLGEDQPVFYVRDNGLGIEPQYHEKIFGLFSKLSRDTDGTGVGLALVKRIVESHGGRLWVESAGLGAGSTFCFTLRGEDQTEGAN